MTQENLNLLFNSIATRRCSLFIGSGATAKNGGATWNDLVDYLIKKYDYKSPLTDNFQIMDDLCEKVGNMKIYEDIRKRLKDAKFQENVQEICSLPWFTAFTTNYDTALEDTLRKNQSIRTRTILTGHEYQIPGSPSEILCVKLMGSLDVPYNDGGSMVINTGDLSLAKDQRSRIFDILSSHAANMTFLFFGYSFSDNIFFEIIQRLIKLIGKPDNTFFALFKEPPSEEKEYLLKQYNVNIIVDDIETFSIKLVEEVKLRNPLDLSYKKIPIGKDIIPIETDNIQNFIEKYNPILLEDLETPMDSNLFLKGDINSLRPFGEGINFKRKEVKNIIDNITNNNDTSNKFFTFSINGNPGTGRSFLILDTIYSLITEYRSIGIQISNSVFSPIPSIEEYNEFISELKNISKDKDIEDINYVVFYSLFRLNDDDIIQLKKLSRRSGVPIILLFEDIPTPIAYEDLLYIKDEITYIDLNVGLSRSDKEELSEYLIEINKKLGLPQLLKKDAKKIINEETNFIGIIYRSIDPARRSINNIIEIEYTSLQNEALKDCILICSISGSINIDLPLSVLRKTISRKKNKTFTYPDIFDIIDVGRSFLVSMVDIRTNYLVNIYNVYIAQHLLELINIEKIDNYLKIICESVDLKSKIEAEFIGNLLISKGVNCPEYQYQPFSNDGLINAFSILKERQPARPVIHHFAKLLSKNNIQDEKIIPLLHEGLREPIDDFALYERKENILTTLGLSLWNQKKETLLKETLDNLEIREIFDYLDAAKTSSSLNLHPYHIQARIIQEMSENKDDQIKTKLIIKALDILEEGITIAYNYPEETQILNEKKFELLSEIDKDKALEIAERLKIENNDGTGYYTIAKIEYYKEKNNTKANLYLDKSIESLHYPINAIAMKIEILLKDNNIPNYNTLLKYANRIDNDNNFRFNWKSHYFNGIIYLINGNYNLARHHFTKSNNLYSGYLDPLIQIFWMEHGSRKIIYGKIGRNITEKTGWIYSHNIDGWNSDIFFNPKRQKAKSKLKPGTFVEFYLGFSPKGPIAFDVEPRSD